MCAAWVERERKFLFGHLHRCLWESDGNTLSANFRSPRRRRTSLTSNKKLLKFSVSHELSAATHHILSSENVSWSLTWSLRNISFSLSRSFRRLWPCFTDLGIGRHYMLYHHTLVQSAQSWLECAAWHSIFADLIFSKTWSSQKPAGDGNSYLWRPFPS